MHKTSRFIAYYVPESLGLNALAPDCTCPYTIPAAALATLSLETLVQRHPQQQHIALSDEYSVVYVPSLSRLAVLNSEALGLLHRFSEPQSLAHLDTDEYAAVQQFYDLGLLHPYGSQPADLPDPDTLIAWLHITNACNMHCSYCYVEQGNEVMSAETALATIDAVLRSAQQHVYRHVHLKYAGGEASLNLPLVAQTHRYACEQAAAAGIDVQGAILSNGIDLDDSKLQLIQDLGLRLMISLDGPQPFHDAQRYRHGGQGTFTAVIDSIERAQNVGLDLTVSVTVTSINIGGLPELLDWLLARAIHFTLNFYREHDHNMAHSEHTHLQADEQQLIDGMRAAYRVIEQRPPHYSVLGSLLDRTNLTAPHRYTCPVGSHYLVIDPRGRVTKCQMDMQHPITTVWDTDLLGALQRDETRVQNLPVEHKETCRDCQWRYWCAGGCALVTNYATGRYDAPSPNCAIYQALLPDVIRLEGLRLLHQAHHS